MTKPLIIAAIAACFGSAALAGPGCSGAHDKHVMSCANGTVWDAESSTCIPVPTG